MAGYYLYSQEPLEEGESYGSTRPWCSNDEEGEWAASAMPGTYLSPPRDGGRSRFERVIHHHNRTVASNCYDPPPCPSTPVLDDYTGTPLDPHLHKSLFGDEDGMTEGKGLYSFSTARTIKGEMFSRFNQDGQLIRPPSVSEAFYLEADHPVFIQTLFTTNLGYLHVLPDWTKIYMKITRDNFDVASVSMSCIDIWRPSTKAAYERAVSAQCTTWLLPSPCVQQIASLASSSVVSKFSLGKVFMITFARPMSKLSDHAVFKTIDTGNLTKVSGAQPILDGTALQARVLASISSSYTGCTTLMSGDHYANGSAEACAAAVIDTQVKGKYFKIFSPEFPVCLKHKRVEFLALFPAELADRVEEFIDVKCHNFYLLKMKKPMVEYKIRSLCLDKKGVSIICVSEQEYYSSRNDSACLTKQPCLKKKKVNNSWLMVVATDDEQDFMAKFYTAVARDPRMSVHGTDYTDGTLRVLFSAAGFGAKRRAAFDGVVGLMSHHGGRLIEIQDSADFTQQMRSLGEGLHNMSLYESVSRAPHTCNKSLTHCRFIAVCDENCVLGNPFDEAVAADNPSGGSDETGLDAFGGHGNENTVQTYVTRVGDIYTPRSAESMSTEEVLGLPHMEHAVTRLLKESELLTKHAIGLDRRLPFLEHGMPCDRYGYVQPCASAIVASEENYGRDENGIRAAQTTGKRAMLSRHMFRGSVWTDEQPAADGGPSDRFTVADMINKKFD